VSKSLDLAFNHRTLCHWLVCPVIAIAASFTDSKLAALNETLTEFYTKSGVMIPPDEWLGENPYHLAFFDDSEEWMNH
jgi:hypothetical protein